MRSRDLNPNALQILEKGKLLLWANIVIVFKGS